MEQPAQVIRSSSAQRRDARARAGAEPHAIDPELSAGLEEYADVAIWAVCSRCGNRYGRLGPHCIDFESMVVDGASRMPQKSLGAAGHLSEPARLTMPRPHMLARHVATGFQFECSCGKKTRRTHRSLASAFLRAAITSQCPVEI